MRSIVLLILVGLCWTVPAAAARFTVVIDPGHGGRGCLPSARDGDHWNPLTRNFEYPYNHGATHGPLEEQALVLTIAREARDILRRAGTAEGFPAFRQILARYGRPRFGIFPRPDIRILLTREDDFRSADKAQLHNANRFYRLYDSPLSFLPDGRPHPRLYPGRLTWINMLEPQLVVALHINASQDPSVRGQAAVITPHGDWFHLLDALRQDAGPRGAEDLARLLGWYGIGEPVFSRLAAMPRDVDTYFDRHTAYPRHRRLTWAYGSDSAWRRREAGPMERLRRGGGLHPGGDNLRASEDMLRWLRRALIHAGGLAPSTDAATVREHIGPLGKPFVRDYALPMFVNAICAYLEIAHLTNARDRRLLREHPRAYAEGIAVGIYALLYGLEPHPSGDDAPGGAGAPAAAPLDLQAYHRGGVDYFRQVSAPGRPFPPWVLTWREREPDFVRAKEAGAQGELPALGAKKAVKGKKTKKRRLPRKRRGRR